MKIKEKSIRISLFNRELHAWMELFPELSTEKKVLLRDDDDRRTSIFSEFSLSEITGGDGAVLLTVEKTDNCEFLITYVDEDLVILNRNFPVSKKELALYMEGQ